MKKYIRNTAIALMTATALFSCDKFLEESPKDKLPEDEVYNNLSDLYLNAVASLYTYIGGYSDSQDFIVGESGGDAGRIGQVTSSVVTYIDNQSVAGG